MESHLDIVKHIKKGEYPTQFDWSIYEWEQLRPNDMFILLQVGTDNDGIAMVGKFVTEAYEDESWRNDGKTVHYANMEIFDAFDLSKEINMHAENFEKDIYIKWHGGHSGELLKEEIASQLIEKMKEAAKDKKNWEGTALEDFLKRPILLVNDEDEADLEFCKEKKDDLLKLLSPYSPKVHTNEEDGYDYYEDDEVDIEFHNSDHSLKLSVTILYCELSINCGDFLQDYEPTEEGYEELKKQLLKILNNQACIILTKENKEYVDFHMSDTLWSKGTSLSTLLKELKYNEKQSKKVTSIKVLYWNPELSFEAK
jgi:hypothetical protein